MLLHADVDAFFAAVAQRDDPSLRGRPVLVGSWVVMAASYEARAYGIRGGMRAVEARRRCPDALFVSPGFDRYVAASRDVFAVLEALGAPMERGSMEEAFLDVTGLGPPAELGERVRREVREQAGLALSVGVGRTKVLAKLASRAAKPDGLRVIAPRDERAFLHPLAVEDVWGVGPVTARKLRSAGFATVGDVARAEPGHLVALLGKAAARYVAAVAEGGEVLPLQPRRERRSFGAQRSLAGAARRRAEGAQPRGDPMRAGVDPVRAGLDPVRAGLDPVRAGVDPVRAGLDPVRAGRDAAHADLDAALETVVERVASRMARAGRTGRTVTVQVRLGYDGGWTRSRTLGCPTACPETLLGVARGLVEEVDPAAVTRVRVAVGNLDSLTARQLTLGLEEG